MTKSNEPANTRRSVCLPDDVYENVCALAREKHTTPAAVMRSLIVKGLSVAFIEDSESLLRKIFHEEGKVIADHGENRVAKICVKAGLLSGANLIVNASLLLHDYMGEISLQDLLSNAFKWASAYMRTREKSDEEYAEQAKELVDAAKSIVRKDDN